ncbi:hypothetical protein LCAC16_PA110004 [Leuconostoc carnosum]|nr:hypothetical protein LCAC16_PA110004 [Leuconostoc carnosum]
MKWNLRWIQNLSIKIKSYAIGYEPIRLSIIGNNESKLLTLENIYVYLYLNRIQQKGK